MVMRRTRCRRGPRCAPHLLLALLLGLLSWLPQITGAQEEEIRIKETIVESPPSAPSAKSAPQSNSPGVIEYQDMTHDGCSEACAKETKISCRYFKFLPETTTCMLSETDSPGSRKAVSRVFNELESKIEQLEGEEADIEDMKSMLSELREEMKILRRSHKSEDERNRAAQAEQRKLFEELNQKISYLKLDDEKFKAALHALSNMQRTLAKEIGGLKDEQKDVLLKLTEIDKNSKDLETLTASLSATDGTLQREIDQIKENTNDLSNKLEKLREHVAKQVSGDKLTPAIVKLKHNQGALATALESMEDKVSGLIARVPYLEKELRTTDEKVSNEAVYEQDLQAKLKVLYKNLVELKKAVHNLQDPRSAINMERSKGVLKLKSDVSMLAQMDKGMRSELEDEKQDVANLVKDVGRVQLMAQSLRDKLALVLTASREFQQQISSLKEGQRNALSVVEVAQMQKQVLVALNRLKTRETILMKQLDKYRESVRTITEKVQASGEEKSEVHHMVTQLKHNLQKFEEQIKALYAKTKTLDAKIKEEKTGQTGTEELSKAQETTNARVEDLLNQMKIMESRIALLGQNIREDEIKERTKEKEQKQKEEKEKELKKKKKEREKTKVAATEVAFGGTPPPAADTSSSASSDAEKKNQQSSFPGLWDNPLTSVFSSATKPETPAEPKETAKGTTTEEIDIKQINGKSLVTVKEKGNKGTKDGKGKQKKDTSAKDKKGGKAKKSLGKRNNKEEVKVNTKEKGRRRKRRLLKKKGATTEEIDIKQINPLTSVFSSATKPETPAEPKETAKGATTEEIDIKQVNGKSLLKITEKGNKDTKDRKSKQKKDRSGNDKKGGKAKKSLGKRNDREVKVNTKEKDEKGAF